MYSCRSCDMAVSEDELAAQMVNGCLKCGNRVFKIQKSATQPKTATEMQKILQDQMNDDIAIHVRNKGQYTVNLNALVARDSGMDPILIQDNTGKINVLLNPDPK